MTEDHCVPQPDWVKQLVDAQAPGRAAVGGVVETVPSANAVDWAFYLVDFFRYMMPVMRAVRHRSRSATSRIAVNISKPSSDLWQTIFHETAINEALRARFGELWLTPAAEVRMQRNVRFANAVYERYAFGRLFGCTRLEFTGTARRLYYVLFAPALPVLLLGRMAGKA